MWFLKFKLLRNPSPRFNFKVLKIHITSLFNKDFFKKEQWSFLDLFLWHYFCFITYNHPPCAKLAPGPPTSFYRLCLMDGWMDYNGIFIIPASLDPQVLCQCSLLWWQRMWRKKRRMHNWKNEKQTTLQKKVKQPKTCLSEGKCHLLSITVTRRQCDYLPSMHLSNPPWKRQRHQETKWKRENVFQDYSTSEASLSEGR